MAKQIKFAARLRKERHTMGEAGISRSSLYRRWPPRPPVPVTVAGTSGAARDDCTTDMESEGEPT